jgi:probable F420-dependent oxidoreductase
MSRTRPFRFGINAFQATSAADWKESACKAEALGYSSFVVADHISTQMAPIASLVAVASATSTLRVGSYVFGNDFWHPAVLAREAATIDLLSDGRLELGIGTGWEQPDYEQRGILKDSPGTQVSRFEEAVQVIKGLLGEQPLTFAGKHYTINGYNMLPKPVQHPRPPLLIGGGGRRMLALAVREAEIVGINPVMTPTGAPMTAQATDGQIAWVRELAGTRLNDLEMNNIVLAVRISEDRQAAAEQLNRDYPTWEHGLSVAEMLESPYLLFGTIGQIVEQLQERRERYGISYLTFYGEHHLDLCAPIVARLAGT